MLSTGVRPAGADKEHSHLTAPSSDYTLKPTVCQIKTTTHWLFASANIKGWLTTSGRSQPCQPLSSTPLCLSALSSVVCFLSNIPTGPERISGLSTGAPLRRFCHVLHTSSFRWPLKTQNFRHQHWSLSIRKTSHQKNENISKNIFYIHFYSHSSTAILTWERFPSLVTLFSLISEL